MNHVAVPDINTNVVDSASVCEKYQIARLQILTAYIRSVIALICRNTVDADSVLCTYILYQTGAIETGGGSTAPYIRNAEILHCRIYNSLSA